MLPLYPYSDDHEIGLVLPVAVHLPMCTCLQALLDNSQRDMLPLPPPSLCKWCCLWAVHPMNVTCVRASH
jgi:hypothetical protein